MKDGNFLTQSTTYAIYIPRFNRIITRSSEISTLDSSKSITVVVSGVQCRL